MRHLVILMALSLISWQTLAEDWVPEVKFQLENVTYKETLIWVSGVSYAVSQNQLEHKLSNAPSYLCGAPESIGSKQLLEYLNNAHLNQNITSEQAIKTIYLGLKESYPCA